MKNFYLFALDNDVKVFLRNGIHRSGHIQLVPCFMTAPDHVHSMEVKMKKAIGFISILLCAAMLFAGGSSETAAPEAETTAPAQTSGPVEITLLSNSVKPYDTAIPAIIEEFEAQNPDIKVNIEMLPTTNLLEVVEVRLGSGEAVPDVFFVDAPMVMAYSVKQYLEPLDQYFTAEEMDQFMDVCRNYCTVDGTLYAAPFVNSSQVLYYNTRIFDELGIPHLSKDPAERLTWEEVVELAKQLTIDEDGNGTPEVFGLGIGQVSRPFQMLTMPESLGGQPIGDDGTVTGVLTTEPWLKAGQFIQDLFNTWNVSPKGVSASDMLAYFVSEKVAMLIGPDYNYLSYSQNDELEWDYAPYPYFAEGTPVTPTGSWSLGINSNSQHKDAAAKLIKFLTLNPVCIEWFKMDGHLPANKTTIEYINSEPMYDEWPHNIFDLLQYESANTAVPRPLSAGYLEYENMLTTAFEDIRNGADVKTTLEQVEVRIDRALSRYN